MGGAGRAGRPAPGRRARAARGAGRGRARAGRHARVAPGTPALRVRPAGPAAGAQLAGTQWQHLADEDVRGPPRDRDDAPLSLRVESRQVLDARDEGAVGPRQPGAVRTHGHLPFESLVGGQQPLLRRAGHRRPRARGVAGSRADRAPGAVLSGHRRAVVPDRRAQPGPGLATLLRREAPVAQLPPDADQGAVSRRPRGLPRAGLPGRGLLGAGRRRAARLCRLRPGVPHE